MDSRVKRRFYQQNIYAFSKTARVSERALDLCCLGWQPTAVEIKGSAPNRQNYL